MGMPGRSYAATSGGEYRFGFNGKEGDSDFKGEGNSYNFGARIYDPRIGRLLSVDPLANPYATFAPYCFAGNNPVKLIDKEGKGPNEPPPTPKPNCLIVIASAEEIELNYKNSGDMGSFHIIFATDISQATEAASAYYGESKIENLVVYSHASESKDLVTQPEEYVSPRDGESYVTNTIGTEEIAMYNTDPSNSSGALGDKDFTDINQLDQLFDLVTPGGNVVLAACSFGDNATTGQLEVAKLAENEVTFYFNRDYSSAPNVDGVLQVWMGGEGITRSQYFEEGWIKLEAGSGSEPEPLKDKDGYTGNIFLDSRKDQEAVNEQKIQN
jgi:RHS repeat-associated protein